jgi:predicted AAA+ superfamily ATPase
MQNLVTYSQQKIRETPLKFKRYLFDQINWDDRLIGITGARGVGKTTMILQYIKESYRFSPEALYITLDNFYFTKNRLFNLLESFYMDG